MVEQPAQLRSREVRRGGETREFPKPRGPDRALEVRREVGGPGVLPHDRRRQRLAGRGVPDHRRLPLIRDPDRRDVLAFETSVGERPGGHLGGAVPDFRRVVFHPAGTRGALAMLTLRRAHHRAVPREEQAAAAGGALVDRGHHPGPRPTARRGAHGVFRRSALPGLAPVTSPS